MQYRTQRTMFVALAFFIGMHDPACAQSEAVALPLQSMNTQQLNAALIAAADQKAATQNLGAPALLPSARQPRLPHEFSEMPFLAKKDFPELSIAKAILAEPEHAIDLARVETAIERLIDPTVNVPDTLHQLDLLAAAAKARFPQGDATDPEQKGLILYSTMRDAGPWNDYRPFAYDLDDPFGRNAHTKLLSSFLATRKGNCVTMPVLFVVLAQKLGLPATLSTAPHHEFAKFRKDDGSWTNLEVTSYGGMTDEHYIEQMEITQRALANHLWLQTLTKKQSAARMFEPLLQYYQESKQSEKGLALTGLLLNATSSDVSYRDISYTIFRGNMFCQLSDQRYGKYGASTSIPVSQREDWKSLENNCHLNHAIAEELGWVEESAQHRAKYVQFMQEMKAKQQGAR